MNISEEQPIWHETQVLKLKRYIHILKLGQLIVFKHRDKFSEYFFELNKEECICKLIKLRKINLSPNDISFKLYYSQQLNLHIFGIFNSELILLYIILFSYFPKLSFKLTNDLAIFLILSLF